MSRRATRCGVHILMDGRLMLGKGAEGEEPTEVGISGLSGSGRGRGGQAQAMRRCACPARPAASFWFHHAASGKAPPLAPRPPLSPTAGRPRPSPANFAPSIRILFPQHPAERAAPKRASSRPGPRPRPASSPCTWLLCTRPVPPAPAASVVRGVRVHKR